MCRTFQVRAFVYVLLQKLTLSVIFCNSRCYESLFKEIESTEVRTSQVQAFACIYTEKISNQKCDLSLNRFL